MTFHFANNLVVLRNYAVAHLSLLGTLPLLLCGLSRSDGQVLFFMHLWCTHIHI